jgi:hypothetical protein
MSTAPCPTSPCNPRGAGPHNAMHVLGRVRVPFIAGGLSLHRTRPNRSFGDAGGMPSQCTQQEAPKYRSVAFLVRVSRRASTLTRLSTRLLEQPLGPCEVSLLAPQIVRMSKGDRATAAWPAATILRRRSCSSEPTSLPNAVNEHASPTASVCSSAPKAHLYLADRGPLLDVM